MLDPACHTNFYLAILTYYQHCFSISIAILFALCIFLTDECQEVSDDCPECIDTADSFICPCSQEDIDG